MITGHHNEWSLFIVSHLEDRFAFDELHTADIIAVVHMNARARVQRHMAAVFEIDGALLADRGHIRWIAKYTVRRQQADGACHEYCGGNRERSSTRLALQWTYAWIASGLSCTDCIPDLGHTLEHLSVLRIRLEPASKARLRRR